MQNSKSKMKLLQRMWDDELGGQTGTPQERLAAFDRRLAYERRLELFKRLPVTEMAAVFRRLATEDLDRILEDFR